MTKWIIRRAKADDAQALAGSIDAAYSVYSDRVSDLPDVSSGIENDIRDHLVWVAALDGAVTAGAILGLDGQTAQLVNVAVHPDAAGQGIGTALIKAVEKEARAQGATVINLATHRDMPENVALYARLGWHEVERTGNKVIMSKPL